MIEERLHGSARERWAENARLISVGFSLSVSAEESGESLGVTGADAGKTDTTSDCTVRLLQRDNGMRRRRGDDGADSGVREGPVVSVACSINETWRTGSGLGKISSSSFS
jgi:hypothetical protein